MKCKERPGIFIRSPYRRETGGLCRHYVDSVSVVGRHGWHSRSYKFHNLIFYISVFEYRTDDRQCNVLRSYPWIRFSIKVNSDYFRTVYIIGVTEQLLYKLSTTFTDRHSSKSTVSCMWIRTKDHLAASCEHFSHILVDDCNVWRNIDTTVFLGSWKSKHMVIFIDCSPDCAKWVMAVCKYIRNWEFLHSGRFCCLDDSDKCDIVGCHCVKFKL